MAKTPIVKISNITKFMDSLARSLRSNFAWSSQIRKTIRNHPATDRSGNVSGFITIGENEKDKSGNPLSGMIRAFEWGSGIHGTKRAKYIISPKNKTRLAFLWPKATPPYIRGRKLAGTASGGRLSFFYVEHPGVQKRGSIEKSVNATLSKAVPELKLAIRQNIVDIINITVNEINKTTAR
jgi:hypothetical protein